MGWNSYEEEDIKKGMNLTSKILLGIIACVILIILVLCILLINVQNSSFETYINGQITTIAKEKLLTIIDDVTYVNIEEFSKLVGYEYHGGEYKSSTIENDKCYIEGKIETVSFYINDNNIYKLPVNQRNEQYQKVETQDQTKILNGKMYASIDTISKAFNVLIESGRNEFKVYTLEYIITIYDSKVKQWGYTGIVNQSFENQKALLYGYIIVNKEGGLYKIIDSKNTKEIVLDRYSEIEFLEYMQQFLVINDLDKVGIVDLNGITKIETIYDEILVLEQDEKLYLVKQNEKYGVVSENGQTIIYPEYDSIGLTNNITANKYLILDELIPVYKDGKYGAFNKKGNLVYNIEYDDFGYNLTNIELNEIKKIVKPLLVIEKVDGVVVKKADKYGLLDLKGKELIPISVDAIYEISGVENENSKYFMIYNGEELNVIERLNKQNTIIDDEENNNQVENEIENNVTNDISIENILINSFGNAIS